MTGTAAQRKKKAHRASKLAFGVTAFLMWRDWDIRDQVFADISASGARWMRVDMGWCSLEENGPGVISTWYQDRLDYVVAQANARGIKLLMTVGCTPTWAGGTDYSVLPGDPGQYQRVMSYLSSRYAGRVAAWEIWNEPDCIGGCGNGSAAAYAPVLKAGFRGVRAGDRHALVVTGGVSGNNVNWLRQLYRAHVKGYFDVVATHPYLAPTTAGPNARGTSMYTIKSVRKVHRLMVRHRDGHKKIWFTEFGWSTPGADTDRPGVTPDEQASYLRQSARVMLAYPYVNRAFWYAIRDRDDSSPYENHFGLFDVDGTPKPSWSAFASTARALRAR